jgi:integrase
MLGEWPPSATMEIIMAHARRPSRIRTRGDWKRSAKGCWSLSLGERGSRVLIFQRVPEGSFFRETWIEGRGRTAASLHTMSKGEARRLGEAFYLALVTGQQPQPRPSLTLEELWRRYQEDSPGFRLLSRRSRQDRIADVKLLLAAFGERKVVEHLTLADVESYVEMRKRGIGWRDGRRTPPVGNRTIASDLQTLRTIVLWATRVRTADGNWLLQDNPLRGLKLPREENPNRPVATYDRFLALRTAIQELAAQVSREDHRLQWVRLELALVVAEATGARIGAIGGLRWSDISYNPPRLRWRAEFDKRGRDRTIPLTPELSQELRSFQARLGGIGEGWFFPTSSKDKHWSRELFAQKLLLAEQRAGLEHLKGGVWHPFRRKWATERKDLPLVDVMATGGWKDTATLLTCYQHTDEHSMLRVLATPKKLTGLRTEKIEETAAKLRQG